MNLFQKSHPVLIFALLSLFLIVPLPSSAAGSGRGSQALDDQVPQGQPGPWQDAGSGFQWRKTYLAPYDMLDLKSTDPTLKIDIATVDWATTPISNLMASSGTADIAFHGGATGTRIDLQGSIISVAVVHVKYKSDASSAHTSLRHTLVLQTALFPHGNSGGTGVPPAIYTADDYSPPDLQVGQKAPQSQIGSINFIVFVDGAMQPWYEDSVIYQTEMLKRMFSPAGVRFMIYSDDDLHPQRAYLKSLGCVLTVPERCIDENISSWTNGTPAMFVTNPQGYLTFVQVGWGSDSTGTLYVLNNMSKYLLTVITPQQKKKVLAMMQKDLAMKLKDLATYRKQFTTILNDPSQVDKPEPDTEDPAPAPSN